MSFSPTIIGVAVVFNRKGQVLIDQRLDQGLLAGMWEFPGGKQESDESIEQTIEREVEEEVAIKVKVGERLIVTDHTYGDKQFRFIVHICGWLSGIPQPLASQQVLWVAPKALKDFPFPAANAKIITALMEYLFENIDK